MSSHPDDNTLAQLVDRVLDEATRAEIERHLDTCATCSDLVAELAFVVTPGAREAPPGYRLLREIEGKAWVATAVGDDTKLALGFDGPWTHALVRVHHPHVASIEAVGIQEDASYIVHELGTRTLRQWRVERSRSESEILDVGMRVLAGLAALHRADLVHGRLSPEHIFVEPDDRVFVGGFARELAKTSGYVAPELFDGAAPTRASDQFAACAVLWEALADARPYNGATPGALAVAMATPPALPTSGPRRLFSVLQRGLAADPAARWPSLAALGRELTAASKPSRAIPLLAAAALVVIAVVVYLLVR